MLLAAGRRFLLLVVGISAVLAAGSTLVALALGLSVNRSISISFEVFGSLLLVVGFFFGNRGPLRARGGDDIPFRPRLMRRATAEEREESINESAVIVVLGLVLVLIGLAIDDRIQLL
jgi:hypothetical protein